MALTSLQSAQIYRLLGYSDRHQDVAGGRSQRIQQALAGLSSAIETEVTGLLGTTADAGTAKTLLGIENAIAAQRTRRKALTVGSIALNPAELAQLRSEGTAYLGQLASLLGLEVLSNPFYPSLGAQAAKRLMPGFA